MSNQFTRPEGTGGKSILGSDNKNPPNDGALFAPGSLSFCGSLSYNNYNNNVSKILENAIRGFLKDGPLP